jgi:hypothetical protein
VSPFSTREDYKRVVREIYDEVDTGVAGELEFDEFK